MNNYLKENYIKMITPKRFKVKLNSPEKIEKDIFTRKRKLHLSNISQVQTKSKEINFLMKNCFLLLQR